MIELSHIGEKIISYMINDSYKTKNYILKKIGKDIYTNDCIAIPEIKLCNCGELGFDGMHKIDIALLNSNNNSCIAIEAKLGKDRLSTNAFEKRFLNECKKSNHELQRINGSTIAILDRRFNDELKSHKYKPFEIKYNNKNYILDNKWILIARKKVIDSWGDNPPSVRYPRHSRGLENR